MKNDSKKESAKKLIESLVFRSLLEFRSTFKWNEFTSLSEVSGWSALIEYAKTHNLPFLGEGSARIVFALPNTKYVLKIAKSDKGISQNQAEVDVYTNPKTKNIVAKIFNFDRDYTWIVSETVKEFESSEEFKQAVGIDITRLTSFYEDMLKHGDKWYEPTVKRITYDYGTTLVAKRYLKAADEIINNSLAKDFANLIQATELIRADLGVEEHWGKTASGRIVILDYGFTEEVYQKHYIE